MLYDIPKTVETDIRFVKIDVNIRHEEDFPKDFPFRHGSTWSLTIDIDSGVILDWPQGVSGDLYMKVCDEGSYYLFDADMNQVGAIASGYVPNDLIPGDYGDYIGLEIDATGKVTNWPKHPNLDKFFEND